MSILERDSGQIPADKPVTGNDLNDLREKLGLKVAEFCMVFAFSMNQWAKIKAAGNTPVRDPAIALYARFLDRYPEFCPLPPGKTVPELVEALRGVGIELTKKELGLLLGREASSGYRWIEQHGRTPQLLSRIVQTIERAGGQSPKDLQRTWRAWCDIAFSEASARGIDNLMDTNNWEKDRVSPLWKPGEDTKPPNTSKQRTKAAGEAKPRPAKSGGRTGTAKKPRSARA